MFNMNMLNGMMGGGAGARGMTDEKKPDTSEQIIISSLALLKMLKHGKNRFLEFLVDFGIPVYWWDLLQEGVRDKSGLAAERPL